MLSRNFQSMIIAKFLGVNAKDTPNNILDGEFTSDSLNVYSNKKGELATLPGYSAITSASIGSATAWNGVYQYRKAAGTDYIVGGTSDGKAYLFASNAYTEIGNGLASGIDKRFVFSQLDDICFFTDGTNLMKYTGTGSIATLAGTLATCDWLISQWRYSFLHSTVDNRLLYYCTVLGSVESGYTSFINFDDDTGPLTGACRHGDDVIVGKSNSLYRVQYTGESPKFRKYRIPATIGPVNFQVMKELPDGTGVVYLASDNQVYMLSGDVNIPVGDNIRDYIAAGKAARRQYATAGMLYEKSLYFLSFSYTSTSQNDRTVVMDWSRPYPDAMGKTQYPWFITSIGANCFGEIISSGASYLYHGGYVGKLYQEFTGLTFDGSAFTATYSGPFKSLGSPTHEKKFSDIALTYDQKGSHNLTITTTVDENSSTAKIITQDMGSGSGYLHKTREISRFGKGIQIQFQTSGASQPWLIRDYELLIKPLRSGTNRKIET